MDISLSESGGVARAGQGSTANIARRTVVKGLIWTVPTVAIATAAPQASASTANVAFSQGSYSGSACGPIQGVTVTLTPAEAGKSVAVQLSGGYTFSDGSTSYSGLTDASGVVAVPAIVPPGAGGTAVVTASSNSRTATAIFSATAKPRVGRLYYGAFRSTNEPNSEFAVPFNARSVGGRHWLTDDGQLGHAGGGVIATGVTDAVGRRLNTNDSIVHFQQNGFGKIAVNAAVQPNNYRIPVNSKTLGAGYWLGANGNLYHVRTNGTIASGVTSAAAEEGGPYGNEPLVWLTANGMGQLYYGASRFRGEPNSEFAVPLNARSVGGRYWLTDDGQLGHAGDGVIATGVTDAMGRRVSTNDSIAHFQQNGFGKIAVNTNVDRNDYRIPANSKTLGAGYWLGANGNLYTVRTNGAIASGVTGAAAEEGGPYGNDPLVWATPTNCS